jgi:hypothetical protein
MIVILASKRMKSKSVVVAACGFLLAASRFARFECKEDSAGDAKNTCTTKHSPLRPNGFLDPAHAERDPFLVGRVTGKRLYWLSRVRFGPRFGATKCSKLRYRDSHSRIRPAMAHSPRRFSLLARSGPLPFKAELNSGHSQGTGLYSARRRTAFPATRRRTDFTPRARWDGKGRLPEFGGT